MTLSPEKSVHRRGRGTLRRAAGVLLAGAAVAVLAAVVALVLVRHGGDADAALLRVHAVRPWLVAGQVAILVLAWVRWPRIVAALARWQSLSPAQHDALLRGRHRIFLLLLACELVIVLRAIAG